MSCIPFMYLANLWMKCEDLFSEWHSFSNLFYSIGSLAALRVPLAVTWLTVYRQLQIVFHPCAWAQTLGVRDVHLATSKGLKRRQLSCASSDQNLFFRKSPDPWRGMSWASRTIVLDTSIVFMENLITIWLVEREQFNVEDPICRK